MTNKRRHKRKIYRTKNTKIVETDLEKDIEDKEVPEYKLQSNSELIIGDESKTEFKHKIKHECQSDSEYDLLYKLVKKLGKGGNGVVYEAIDKISHEIVAVKQCCIGTRSGINLTILREMSALFAFRGHPRIVQLLRVLNDRENTYLVLERMDCSLYSWIDNDDQYDPSLLISFMYQILEGLDLIHSHGFIHRDIKPGNILLKGTQLKLADFGTVRFGYQKVVTESNHTTNITTLGYRAPEMILEDPKYHYKVDMWSAGCVFAELSSRRNLIDSKTEVSDVLHILTPLTETERLKFTKLKDRQEKKHDALFSWEEFVSSNSKTNGLTLEQQIQLADLLKNLLVYEPDKRLNARQALKHPLFKFCREKTNKAL